MAAASLSENLTGSAAHHSSIASNISSFFDALDNLSPPGGSANAHDHHAHAGHSGHGSHGAHGGHEGHMMKMWFHGGCEEVILFDFWRIDSCFGLLLSCLGIFVMGALYEGVKWFRVYLQLSRDRCQKKKNQKGNGMDQGNSHALLHKNNPSDNGDFVLSETPPCSSSPTRSRSGDVLCVFRLVEALLYSFQLVLAYWLMLIVMTYNTWLTIAVIGGAGFGHWLFAILNILNPHEDSRDSFTTDACH